MKNRMTILLIACVAALVFLVVQINAACKQKKSTTRPLAWKLPKETYVTPDDFHVTADARYAFFEEMKWSAQDLDADRRPEMRHWMFETRTGKLTKLEDLLAKATKDKKFEMFSSKPSPDGKYVLLTVRKAGWSDMVPFTDPMTAPSIRRDRIIMTAFLVSLEDKKVRKLAEAGNIDPPCWFGGKVALSQVNEKGRFEPISLFDPTGKDKPVKWKVRGKLADANYQTKVILCSCDPDKPDKPSTHVLTNKQLVAMTIQGKVLRRLGPADLVTGAAVLSPKAVYVAFQRNNTRTPSDQLPKGRYVQVMSVKGKAAWKINEVAEPIAVSDDGKVITIGDEWDEDSVPIKIWDKKGKSRTLVKDVMAATVASGRLFYVTPGKQPVIKSVPVPVPPKKSVGGR